MNLLTSVVAILALFATPETTSKFQEVGIKVVALVVLVVSNIVYMHEQTKLDKDKP